MFKKVSNRILTIKVVEREIDFKRKIKKLFNYNRFC